MKHTKIQIRYTSFKKTLYKTNSQEQPYKLVRPFSKIIQLAYLYNKHGYV